MYCRKCGAKFDNHLVKCPKCGTEGKMEASGATLSCTECGKNWFMDEYGQLEGDDGRTEFKDIPEWSRWERDIVRERIRNGTYHFEDTVRVETLPNSLGFRKQGVGKLVQTPEGTTLTCTCYGEPTTIEKPGIALESMHIEYDYRGNGDCVDISIPDDSFWCYLTKKDVITQLAFATEEIHIYAKEKREQEKLARANKNKENENVSN